MAKVAIVPTPNELPINIEEKVDAGMILVTTLNPSVFINIPDIIERG